MTTGHEMNSSTTAQLPVESAGIGSRISFATSTLWTTTLPQRGQPGFHRLQKVKGVLDMVRERFTAVYSPHACISVDEAMIPFKGETPNMLHV